MIENKILPTIIVFLFVLIFMALIFSFPIMWLWNWLMPVIFGLPVINIWQALGLYILSGLLIKSTAQVK